MNNTDYTVYAHISPSKKIYIGVTCTSVTSRWGSGGYRYSKQPIFYKAIQKYGWDNIKHIVLIEGLSRDEACECEKYLIKKYNTTDREFGYNSTQGGDGTFSDDTRHKMSISHIGKKKSKDAIEKMRKKLIGHEVSQVTRMKIRNANTGYQHTEEARKKMSEHNCMHNPDIVNKMKESLKKSQKERTEKRMKTMKERYPNGIPITPEYREHLSNALRGKRRSEATKQKMHKPKSKEHIEHMREAQRLSHKARKMGMTYKEYLLQLQLGNIPDSDK